MNLKERAQLLRDTASFAEDEITAAMEDDVRETADLLDQLAEDLPDAAFALKHHAKECYSYAELFPAGSDEWFALRAKADRVVELYNRLENLKGQE